MPRKRGLVLIALCGAWSCGTPLPPVDGYWVVGGRPGSRFTYDYLVLSQSGDAVAGLACGTEEGSVIYRARLH